MRLKIILLFTLLTLPIFCASQTMEDLSKVKLQEINEQIQAKDFNQDRWNVYAQYINSYCSFISVDKEVTDDIYESFFQTCERDSINEFYRFVFLNNECFDPVLENRIKAYLDKHLKEDNRFYSKLISIYKLDSFKENVSTRLNETNFSFYKSFYFPNTNKIKWSYSENDLSKLNDLSTSINLGNPLHLDSIFIVTDNMIQNVNGKKRLNNKTYILNRIGAYIMASVGEINSKKVIYRTFQSIDKIDFTIAPKKNEIDFKLSILENILAPKLDYTEKHKISLLRFDTEVDNTKDLDIYYDKILDINYFEKLGWKKYINE